MNKLKSIVDADVYIKLLVMFAGETIYFPAAGTLKDKKERNKVIREKYYNGVSVSELMNIFGISESQIRRIIANKAV